MDFRMLSSGIVFIILFFSECVNCETISNAETFYSLADTVEQRIFKSLSKIIKLDVASQMYTDLRDVEIVEVNGTKILDDVTKEASLLLKKKEQALQDLLSATKEAESDHEEDLTLTLKRVDFFNVKGSEAEEEGALLYNDAFKQNVSFNSSGVHIPLEIYEGYPEILNGLKWSVALDSVFARNMDNDPTLRWQYFASSRGFMRIYPAMRWPENLNPPDLYDVRRRPWYIHSIASPKDVIILIDKSGSVHGQTIDIMKIAVKALIRTLSEDDYVNVAWFNNEVNWVVPCLDSLMPATSQNKRVLVDAVDRLHESNLTSYETALEFAYEAFQRFAENRERWEGANCHKAIMFFSDGGTEWPHELSAHLCNDSTPDCVRVFTFGCGPHPIPTVILKSMACKTRGYFSSITALGAIQNRIQDYVRILGRPLVLTDGATHNLFHWHNIYIDKGGLGPVVSVTLPVPGSSVDPHDPLLLGVLGTDIPTRDLENLYPRHTLGALGYPFAINRNGFVVFHPQLHHHISYLQGEDPPNIDLMEAEGSDSAEMEGIREAMVMGRHGQSSHSRVVVPVSPGRAVLVSLHYHYDKMTTSPFRLGLALPAAHTTLNVRNPSVNFDRLALLRSLQGTLLAPWNYCDDLPLSGDSQELVDDILTHVTDSGKCNDGMLRHLLLDLDRTRWLTSEWERAEMETPGVHSTFISTEGGLTLVRPISRVAEFEHVRDPYKNHHYRRAVSRKNCVLTPSQSKGQEAMVSIACPLRVEKSSKMAHVGVVGAKVDQVLIQAEFSEVLQPHCSDNESLHCHMVDDGGFIVASNQPKFEAASFIGLMDPQLTEHLVRHGYFHLQERHNLQAWCLRGASEATQSGSSLHSPIKSVVSNAVKAMSATSYFIYGLFTSLWQAPPSDAFFGWELLRRNYSCITKSAWIVKGDSLSRHFDDVIECGDCYRKIHVAPLPTLSAILIITEPPCDCMMSASPVHITPQEDGGPDYCSRRKLVRKRRNSCYSFNQKENGTSCYPGDILAGGSSRTTSTSVLLLLCLLILQMKVGSS